MSVYVDDAQIPFRRMLMSHMIADTTEELLEMADKIGVARKWIQFPDTGHEHFDVCQEMRRKALKFGAISITWREYSKRVRERLTA